MITLRYGTNTIVKEKGTYDIRDFKTREGDSTLSKINAEGETRLVDKRRRRDGQLDRLALRLVVDYDEKILLHAMSMGKDKATLANPIEIIISEEGEINGIKKLRYADDDNGFYDEKEVSPTFNGVGSDIYRFYSIDMLFYVL